MPQRKFKRSARIHFSLPPELFALAEADAAELGMSYSELVQARAIVELAAVARARSAYQTAATA